MICPLITSPQTQGGREGEVIAQMPINLQDQLVLFGWRIANGYEMRMQQLAPGPRRPGIRVHLLLGNNLDSDCGPVLISRELVESDK
ncbi:hypothetical protein TNCV_3340641 [Trichonephila clavipes]|nr:hypothetical protein TNCV_3340641 [Trichonephila clavipes]